MAIEIRQTKRTIAYRAVVPNAEPGSKPVAKTFRSMQAAEIWEREMLAELERRARESGAPAARAD
jgi:hypothetical protein